MFARSLSILRRIERPGFVVPAQRAARGGGAALRGFVRERSEPLACLIALLALGPLGLLALLLRLTLRNRRVFVAAHAERVEQVESAGFTHPELDKALDRLGARDVRVVAVRGANVPVSILDRTIVVSGGALYRLLTSAGPAGLDAVLRHELAHVQHRHALRKDLVGHGALIAINAATALLGAGAAAISPLALAVTLVSAGVLADRAGILIINAASRRLERAADAAALVDGHGEGMMAGLTALQSEQDIFERAQAALNALYAAGLTEDAACLRTEFEPHGDLARLEVIVRRAEQAAGIDIAGPRSAFGARLREAWDRLHDSHPATAARIERCARRLNAPATPLTGSGKSA